MIENSEKNTYCAEMCADNEYAKTFKKGWHLLKLIGLTQFTGYDVIRFYGNPQLK